MSRLEFFGSIDLFCEITRAAREYKHNTGGGGRGKEKFQFKILNERDFLQCSSTNNVEMLIYNQSFFHRRRPFLLK